MEWNIQDFFQTPRIECVSLGIRLFRHEMSYEFIGAYAGKFKSSEGSFKADLLPISPQELLTLLQESECHEAMKGAQNSGISDVDLEKLLDRSDLIAKWVSRLNGSNPGQYIKLPCKSHNRVCYSDNK